MFRQAVIGLALGLFAVSAASAAPVKFARYPHVAHGKLAFSYHGDIWVAGADGTNPVRLTAHVARDIFPRFSPDGRWIAFTSNRMGNDDVFVIPAEGGEPRQLTFLTSGDTVLYWTPDGKRIVFSSSRGPRTWGSPLYSVALEGGLPEPLPMDQASNGMIRQDGALVAFNRLGVRYWRKGYKGNGADDVFVQDLKTKKITQLTDVKLEEFRTHVQDLYPMWGADGMIYFSSERDGYFNIWRIASSGGAPAQVTRHGKDGVQFPSISPDGKTIAYENEFELWTLDVPSGTPKKVALDLAFDPKDNLIRYETSKDNADGFDPSPEGDYVAVDVHGEIFVVPTDPESGEKAQVTSSSWRDTRERFSPNGRYIAYASDETKEQEVWLWDRQTGARRKVSALEGFKEIGPWAPDSKHVAFTCANHLYDVEADTAKVTDLGASPGSYQVSGYSPDGKWIAYTRRGDDMNSDVYLFEIATRKEVNVTADPFTDNRGVVTPDGLRVVFLSDRVGGVAQIHVAPLARLAEDPDDPLVKERQKKAKPDKKEAGGEAASALVVEPTGIDKRAKAITSGDQPVATFFLSADGKLVYFMSADERGRGLFSVGIDGKDRKRVADGPFAGLTPTWDRKKVFYAQDGGVYQMDLAGEKKKSKVAFTVTVAIDQRVEWTQVLDECWRVMKYLFYDPKMHGTDWAAVKARYDPLLAFVGENEDVYDLANEMIGELNASHTGVSGPPSREMPAAYSTRYPGLDLVPAEGGFRIGHIFRDGPADKEWLGLKEGQFVVAIDGQRLKAGDNYWQPLSHLTNEYVTLEVADTATAGDKTARKVRIRTVPSLTNVKYEEWVAGNRDFVDKASAGQIAYVHIRSMDQPSLKRFQTEITRFWDKKGIVVDIRFNGGGNIDQELLDILERRPYEYWNNRWGARAWGRRPRQAIAGPKVMLINWRSASDSEVTPMGFRDLGLGRIVGTPTNASVIATGSYRLINGGTVRTPGSLVVTYDPAKPNNYGVNLENYGVAPDVFVENSPEDELNGFDRELKAAVDEALKMLKEGRWQFGGTPPKK